MSQNKFTQLNIGVDGNFMDETGITYPPGSGPVDRRRARVVIAGDDIDKLAEVSTTQLSGTEYALSVRTIEPWQGGMTYEFGFATIAKADPEQELVSFTVAPSTTFYLTGLNCSADGVGLFRVYIDNGITNSQALQFRNNVTNYNILVNSNMPMLQVEAGSTLTVTAKNTTTASNANFEATIMGYTQPT
jgi:hypothetical protein